ncbi:hypothetical protein J6895_02840 [Nakaseomyces glabratus]|nr:hypothetical protein J6895_02840 [Nakaseomyces glabratus]
MPARPTTRRRSTRATVTSRQTSSHITTKDSNGNPTTIVTTIPLKPSDAGEADYTTTIDKGNGDFETDLVPHHHQGLQRQPYHHRHHHPIEAK